MLQRTGSNTMCQMLARQKLILKISTVFDKFNIINDYSESIFCEVFITWVTDFWHMKGWLNSRDQ